MKIRIFAVFAALSLMFALELPALAMQTVVNSTTVTETLKSSSTVYVGEITLDGEIAARYVYSADLTVSDYDSSPFSKLRACLGAMEDGAFAALLDSVDTSKTTKGFAVCGDLSFDAVPDADRSSAANAAAVMFPDAAASADESGYLCDADAAVLAFIEGDAAEREAALTDNTAAHTMLDAGKGFVAYTDVDSVNNVYYTADNGEIIKHVDTYITYTCEHVTVMYTKVALSSGAVQGDVDGDGKLVAKDVIAVLRYLVGWEDDGVSLSAMDYDKSGGVSARDAVEMMKAIVAAQ